MPPAEQSKQYALMLQSLLKERYHLRYHWMNQLRTVYSLVVDKNGPKIHEVPAEPNGHFTIGNGVIAFYVMPIDNLSHDLGGNLDCIVQNRTGLKGVYSFKLDFSNPSAEGGSPNEDDLSNPDAQARLFSALQDQLGLKLVAEKKPVPMLVIDSIDHPTPN